MLMESNVTKAVSLRKTGQGHNCVQRVLTGIWLELEGRLFYHNLGTVTQALLADLDVTNRMLAGEGKRRVAATELRQWPAWWCFIGTGTGKLRVLCFLRPCSTWPPT